MAGMSAVISSPVTAVDTNGATVRVDMCHFSPVEAEQITGVPGDHIRKWRNRGYLTGKASTARTSWELFGLAELMVLGMLSERVGPLLARPIATICANGVAWHALAVADAYEGDHVAVYSWEPQKFAAINENIALATDFVRRFQAGTLNEADKAFRPRRPGWEDQADFLRHNIFHSKGIAGVPQRFFVWLADGSHTWCSSLDTLFGQSGQEFDPRFQGSVLVLDLESLGHLIGTNAGRAFVSVEITHDDHS